MSKELAILIPSLCECGCGQEAKIGNRFIRNHHAPNKGKDLSEEHKMKISMSLKGRPSQKKGVKIKHIIWNKGIKCPKLSEALKGKKHSDLTRLKMSESHKGLKHEEETKSKLGCRGSYHPFYGKPGTFLGRNHSNKSKEKMSKTKKGMYAGENNPNWRGGINTEPYCKEFISAFKMEIKERDGYKCQNPSCYKRSDKLVVHHINYNKKDCCHNNLITICNSCNSMANYNRNYWQELYVNILMENLA